MRPDMNEKCFGMPHLQFSTPTSLPLSSAPRSLQANVKHTPCASLLTTGPRASMMIPILIFVRLKTHRKCTFPCPHRNSHSTLLLSTHLLFLPLSLSLALEIIQTISSHLSSPLPMALSTLPTPHSHPLPCRRNTFLCTAVSTRHVPTRPATTSFCFDSLKETSSIDVTRAEGRPLDVPLLSPFTIASSRLDKVTNVAIRLELRNGNVGWGEAPVLPSVTAEDQETALEAAAKACDFLVKSQPVNLGAALAGVDRLLPGHAFASVRGLT